MTANSDYRTKLAYLKTDAAYLETAISELSALDVFSAPQRFAQLSVNTALQAERITLMLRMLVFTNPCLRPEPYLDQACVLHGITIRCLPNRVEISLPGLFPKRSRHVQSAFLLEPLEAAFAGYTAKQVLPHFSECTVCCEFIYDRSLPLRRIRDYDNVELKKALDIVCSYLMEDDTGYLCDLFCTTSIGEYDQTRICIMTQNSFASWLTERKNNSL